MANKKNNNLLLIAGAVVLYFLLFKKKAAKPSGGGGSGAGSGTMFSNITPQQRARIKADVSKAVKSLNIEPEADEMDSFKKQYYQDIQQCKI